MSRNAIKNILAALAILALLPIPQSRTIQLVTPAKTTFGVTERVSISSTGEQGNEGSYFSFSSNDGRFVSFISLASNLVSGDTNGVRDVFLRDLQTGVIERVSVSSTGEQGNNGSYISSISADGRFVAFDSEASNLVSGDTNGVRDVFLRDLQTGVTERVSLSTTGEQGNNQSGWPTVSADGRFVAFESTASNLVSGDTNGMGDVFVRDRQQGTTERVSLSSTGEQGNEVSYIPSISADGRFAAFASTASNLVSGDTNWDEDIFVHNLQTGVTERVSISSTGEQGNGVSDFLSISADGRFVAFSSFASNLVNADTNETRDVFIRDRQTGTTERVSLSSNGKQGNSESDWSSVSADGRFVAFSSLASNLVIGDTNGVKDIFVRDRQIGATERVSISSSDEQENDFSGLPSISADGRFVTFTSWASNLVSEDTNGYDDVFIHDRCPAGSCDQRSCTLANFGDSNGNPIRQDFGDWADDPYGGTFYTLRDGQIRWLPFVVDGDNKDTIANWGSSLTSAVMIVNYYAELQGNAFRTTPGDLNLWLQQNHGYSTGDPLPKDDPDGPKYIDTSFVNPYKVIEYASKVHGIHISYLGKQTPKKYDQDNKETIPQFMARLNPSLNATICAFNPAILGVNNQAAGHFIDATSVTTDTWGIQDPLAAAPDTLLDRYANTYHQVSFYSGDYPGSYLSVAAHSPLELILTDPLGRRTGYDPKTGQTYSEIPGSSYGDDSLGSADGSGQIEQKTLEVTGTISGTYALEMIGIGTGSYSLEVMAPDPDGVGRLARWSGTTTVGKTEVFLITLPTTPGEPPKVSFPFYFPVIMRTRP